MSTYEHEVPRTHRPVEGAPANPAHLPDLGEQEPLPTPDEELEPTNDPPER